LNVIYQHCRVTMECGLACDGGEDSVSNSEKNSPSSGADGTSLQGCGATSFGK